ncbi:hypothetical protein J4G37_04290 [Microvirga sp. 3-52]|nr:hypothetical protein [Microvirga sp. 3-52]
MRATLRPAVAPIAGFAMGLAGAGLPPCAWGVAGDGLWGAMLKGVPVPAGGAGWTGAAGCVAGGVEDAAPGWRIPKGAADGACCAGSCCGGRTVEGVLGAPGDILKGVCATAFCALSA